MINTKKIKNSNGFLTFYSKGSIIIPNQTDNHPYRISPHTAPRSNGRRGSRAQSPRHETALLVKYQLSRGKPRRYDTPSHTHDTGITNEIDNILGICNGLDAHAGESLISFANQATIHPNFFHNPHKMCIGKIKSGNVHNIL